MKRLDEMKFWGNKRLGVTYHILIANGHEKFEGTMGKLRRVGVKFTADF